MKQTHKTKNLIDICESDTPRTKDDINKEMCELIIKSLKKAPTSSSRNFFFRTLTLGKNTQVGVGKPTFSENYEIETNMRSEESAGSREESPEIVKLELICENQQKKIEFLDKENQRYSSENKRLREELKSVKLDRQKSRAREDKGIISKLKDTVKQLERDKELQLKKIQFLNKKIEENTVNAYEKDNIITVLNQRIEEVTKKYEIEVKSKQHNSPEKGKPLFNIKSINEISQKNLEWSFAEKKSDPEANVSKIKASLKSVEDFLHRTMICVREFFIDSSNNNNRDKIKSLYQHYINNYIENQLIVGDRNTA